MNIGQIHESAQAAVAALLLSLTLAGCAPATQATLPEVPVDAVADATDTAISEDESRDVASARSGEKGSGIVFNLTYRIDPNTNCRRDRATGSHFERDHCRTAEQAQAEAYAAEDLLREAMRNSGQ